MKPNGQLHSVRKGGTAAPAADKKSEFRSQELQEEELRSQELQEFRSWRIWELGEDFPREMLVLHFRIKTLPTYSATPATPDS
jgi:hypothetical protein